MAGKQTLHHPLVIEFARLGQRIAESLGGQLSGRALPVVPARTKAILLV